jgi:hypothetical protein
MLIHAMRPQATPFAQGAGQSACRAARRRDTAGRAVRSGRGAARVLGTEARHGGFERWQDREHLAEIHEVGQTRH